MVGIHGLRGELKVAADTDFPERFAAGSLLWVDARDRREVESGRPHKGRWLVKLRGVDTPEQAARLRGHTLEAPRDSAPALPADTYYVYQLIGLRVLTTAGEAIGALADVMTTGSNDVYLVRGPLGEILVPAIESVVQAVDLNARTLTVEPIPGLLPEPKPGTAPHAE